MRWHEPLMRLCGGFAAATVGLITVLVCADVIARNLGIGGLTWIVEVAEYALPVATLAAAPWLMWRNQHVRLDVINMLLSPRAQRHVDRVSAVVGLVVSLVVAWYGWQALQDSRQAGSIVMKALVFPEWWLYVPVPIGFGLLALECARRVIRPQAADSTVQLPGGA
jgi:TRAP-type C4-dicarboxylate transport system permease small subunit